MPHPLHSKLAPWNQEHLLAGWDRLSPDEQARLSAQINALDLGQLQQLFRQTTAGEDWGALAAKAQPPQAFRLDDPKNRFTRAEARLQGRKILGSGEVGVVLVAGGQGTRLGFPHPKGLFPIGPLSKATLFQILLEKVSAVARRFGTRVPLYVMTSPATHDDTLAFFDRHNRFGLPPTELTVFCQGVMPAVDAATGRLLLAERGSLALSPDGHGGLLAALGRTGALDDMQRRGLTQLFYLQVDNPLAVMCDAEFLGYHLLSGSELSTQVVANAPLDRVGNFVSIDGRARIIEYSDLPPAVAERRNADGSLQLWAGNSAVHWFDLAFLERAAKNADALPFHRARKKVPHLDAAGKRVEPTSENAIKYERFIFDLLPLAKTAIAMEVDEAQVFAPVKNAPGAPRDTPGSVQAQMIALHRGWLRSVGVAVNETATVEIGPLFAQDADDLVAKVQFGVRVGENRYFG